MFIRISATIHNTLSISLDALREFLKLANILLVVFRGRGWGQLNSQTELSVVCVVEGYHLEKQVRVVYCS